MSDSLGTLVDRLSIVNIKLFMVQDRVQAAARDGTGLDPETVRRLDSLNRERNHLMTSIDTCLQAAVRSGDATVEARIKL